MKHNRTKIKVYVVMFETQTLLKRTLTRTSEKRMKHKMKWKQMEYKHIRDKWISKDKFYSMYWNYISYDRNDIKKIQPKEVVLTSHAKYRFMERFETFWHSLDEILRDIRLWVNSIKWCGPDKYSYRCQLGTYIISKEKVVITMIKTSKKQKGTPL